jgi:hypothetical protein
VHYALSASAPARDLRHKPAAETRVHARGKPEGCVYADMFSKVCEQQCGVKMPADHRLGLRSWRERSASAINLDLTAAGCERPLTKTTKIEAVELPLRRA